MASPVGMVNPTEYWHDFVTRYWEREAGMLTPPPIRLGLDEEWFFRAVVDAAAAGDRGEGPLLQLSVAGTRLMKGRARYLPRIEDGTIQRYLKRMDDEVDGAEWSIGLSRLHCTSFEMWERAAEFTSDLWSELGGFTSGYADTDIFLGRYAGTSVGIHCDNAANFMFGVAGPKELLVWPPEDGDWLPLHQPDWFAVRDTAQVLRASRTEMGYFPSRYWHVGSSPEASSATFNIALFFDGDPVSTVLGIINGQLGSVARPPQDRIVAPDGNALPTVLDEVFQSVWSRLDGGAIRDRLLAGWLRKLSAQGFGHMPAPLDLPPVDHDEPLRLHRFSVVYHPTHDNAQLMVAANGQLARLPNHPALAAVLERLNRAEVVTPRELAREHPGETFSDIVDAVLYRLRCWRAIDVMGDLDAG